MKKTSTPTCRALAATSKFRFAGLGILLALAVNAQASMTLNLDLSFDQASIPGKVDFIPGTATGTFTLTGTFFSNSVGDVYGGGHSFASSWSNIVSSPLPDQTDLRFSLVPQSGTVTYDGRTYAQTSIGTKMTYVPRPAPVVVTSGKLVATTAPWAAEAPSATALSVKVGVSNRRHVFTLLFL